MYVEVCIFLCDLVEAECVVDGIKPTVSVDSVGLLVLIGWMNAEHCGLERRGRSVVFSCTVCISSLQISHDRFKVAP